ncbi:MAG: hypothetical protein B6D44_13680 [Ignavibacteriales bacterium UTCHB2]|jgi:hypothetical protein|nr:MAG: hypothetical protein BWY38_00865 [Ignavibacteria bacterium ADurb.Bin266]OQY71037.1 MAG: hypothetical protein B6D44_13680 [Ignavibacteriales bacterium UTCHB2]HQI41961.1 hypothetical protein [Ignavibacteriaceae bacterium]
MSGKAIFFVVMGFSLLFMIAGQFYNGVSGRMTDNYIDYFEQTTAHNIAISGANMAANELFFDADWNAGYNNIDYQNGKLNVTIINSDPKRHQKQIYSVGTYNNITSEVIVTLSPSKFSRFAYFSVSEGAGDIWWINQDTVWGPFHTQDYLKASNHPSFMMSATTLKGLKYYKNEKTDRPIIHGKYDQGVDLALPKDGVIQVKNAALDKSLDGGGYYLAGADAGSVKLTNPKGKSQTVLRDEVYMDFQGEYLYYKYGYKYDTGKKDIKGNIIYATAYFDSVKLYLPDAAPNGVIFVNNGNIHMKGTISGQYTIGCNGNTESIYGNVYLDDDIVYQNNPKTNPGALDLLGIVAKNGVKVTENAANNNDINIHASIYIENGGFGAENYNTRPVSGKINLLGGIQQALRGAVGTFSGTTITHGFSKQYRYDDRLMVLYPPFFPGTGGYEIVSWYE